MALLQLLLPLSALTWFLDKGLERGLPKSSVMSLIISSAYDLFRVEMEVDGDYCYSLGTLTWMA